MFVFGEGFDVNTKLLDFLALNHRGEADYIQPEEDIKAKIAHFFDRVGSPIMTDLEVKFEGVEVQDVYPRKVADIYKGEQVLVYGRYKGDGQAKVTDFGIARSLDVQHGMTQTGTVLGTSDYIAPEQAQGQRVDEQTDVYSLGVVLFEMLTSHVPFPGENFVAVAMRHINEEPPSILDERPDVSPRVDAAVRRAMALCGFLY